MTFRGWILNVQPSTRGGLEVTVSNGSERITAHIAADMTLYAKLHSAATISQLADFPGVKGIETEKWFTPPWYTSDGNVTKVRLDSYCNLLELKKRLQGDYACKLYNLYPDHVTQTLMEINLSPTSLVEAQANSVEPVEDCERVDYTQPDYSWSQIRFFDWFGESSSSPFKTPPARFELVHHTSRGETLEMNEQTRFLEKYSDLMNNLDAIIYPQSFAWLLEANGIKPGSSILKKAYTQPLEAGCHEELVKLVEWSRVSYMPLSLLVDASIGKPLTSNEARHAFHRRFLIPDDSPRLEQWKSFEQLRHHDRGGIIYRPAPGVYFNVAQLDFSSMYPRLISVWNISPETVNAPDASTPVPGCVHTVAKDRRGIVPEAMDYLIYRRESMKRLQGDRGEPFGLRQAALKWLLVASFGYLGFRNAKFGKIEAYECVTALSRHYMLAAVDLALKKGFKVIHVMVDGLFVSMEGAAEEDYAELAQEIQLQTGLKIVVDSLYDWVVFTRNVDSSIGSPARYFGRLTSGSLKVRGLAAIRSDTPLVIKELQTRSLEMLNHAKTPVEFGLAKEKIHDSFQSVRKKIMNRTLDPAGYVFTLNKRRGKLAQGGCGVQLIRGKQLYHAGLGYTEIDVEHYLKALDRAEEQLFPCVIIEHGKRDEASPQPPNLGGNLSARK